MITKLINYFADKSDDLKRKKVKEILALSLVSGFVLGLALSLVSGLVSSLVLGLVSGLVLGLAWGLILGLTLSLVSGLALSLGSIAGVNLVALLFNLGDINISIWLVLGLLLVVELWFLDEDRKPSKEERKSILLFTAKRKLVNLAYLLFLLTQLAGSYFTFITVYPKVKQFFPEIVKWIGYIGVGIVVLSAAAGIVWAYLYLNSLKYRRRKVRR